MRLHKIVFSGIRVLHQAFIVNAKKDNFAVLAAQFNLFTGIHVENCMRKATTLTT